MKEQGYLKEIPSQSRTWTAVEKEAYRELWPDRQHRSIEQILREDLVNKANWHRNEDDTLKEKSLEQLVNSILELHHLKIDFPKPHWPRLVYNDPVRRGEKSGPAKSIEQQKAEAYIALIEVRLLSPS